MRLRFSLCQSGPGDLRLGEHNCRDSAVVVDGFATSNYFGNDNALSHGSVSQHGLPGDIADGKDAFVGGAALIVDGAEAMLVDGDLRGVQCQAIAVGATADRDEHFVELGAGRRIFSFEESFDFLAFVFDFGDFGVQIDGFEDALHMSVQRADQIAVGAHDQSIHHFDDGDFAAQGCVDCSQFHADVAAADYEQALRYVVNVQGSGRINNTFAADIEHLGHHRTRAGGENGVLELDAHGGFAWALHAHIFGILKLSGAVDDVDAGAFAFRGDAACQLVADGELPVAQFVDVDFRFVEMQSEGRGGLCFVDHFRCMQKSFRWDATDVQANAARFGRSIDQHCFDSQFFRAQSRCVATRTGADDDQVDVQYHFADNHGLYLHQQLEGIGQAF